MAFPVNLLQLSPTMTEGTIVKWLVKEGDSVKNGQPIAEIETDKAVMEQEAFEDGKVLKIVVAEGQKVNVESLIMVIGNDGEDISDIVGGGGAKKSAKKADSKEAPKEEKAAAPAAEKEAPSDSSGRVVASPLAKKMAKDAGIELDGVKGSGPNGRVIKRDVEALIEEGADAPAAKSAPATKAAPRTQEVAAAADETITVSGMRKTIARRLVESKTTIPHFQVTVEVRGERLLEVVARLKASYPDAKVTVSHFVIKAMASTLMRHKAFRSQWMGDSINVINGAHISVAVAIEDGLVTPVIRNAHQKGVLKLAEELRELAALARARKLTAEDMSGGVQTLSNLGMFGVHDFTAIINPPEASILAVSAMEDRPVVEHGQIVPGKVMKITMSADHRVVDGAVAAQYLQDLKKSLEDPVLMLL